MQDQPFLGGEVLVFGHLICFINKGDLVNDLAGLFGKVCRHVHEVPPPVDQAVGQDGFELLGSIAAEGVTHLNRRIQFGLPLFAMGPGSGQDKVLIIQR